MPARGLARPRLRHQGRRGRRRLRAGRADGGSQPPLHRRHARDLGRQQPAGGLPRRARHARQRARHRPALDLVAALRRHERPRAAPDHHRPRRRHQRLAARDGLRHHGRLRGHGDPRARARSDRPAPAARLDHGGLQPRRRSCHGRGHRLRGLDDRPAQGRDHAEPRADARGPAGVRALRPVREHRARQLVADRRPHRAQDGRLRDHGVGLRRGHGHAEVHGHRLPPGRDPPGRGRRRRDGQGAARARRLARRQGRARRRSR